MRDVSSTFDRLRFMREAAAIERCHKRPHLIRYSVGHHTHDALTLLILCWKEAYGCLPRAEVLVAMHIHDHPERVTGDIDGFIKNMLADRLGEVEANVERWLGLQTELTEEEASYVLAADKFECYLWAHEEVRRGNQFFSDWIEAFDKKVLDQPMPWPFMDILEEVQVGRLTQMTNQEMLQAGGLS